MVKSDLLIAGSNFIFSHINENYSNYLKSNKKFLVIFRGINIDYFDKTTILESDEDKLLSSWNLTREKKIILMPGRLTSWKGQELFIEAIKKVNTELGYEAFYAVILGSDQGRNIYKKKLLRLVEQHRLNKQIKFIDENERLLSLTDEIDYTLSDGKIIGKHNGAYYYTIGQRKGLAIGGYKDPLFVISTNTQTNEIFVGEGKNHPGLIKKALKVKYSDVNWVNDDYNFENLADLKLKARIRYRQKLQKISIYKHLDYLYVEFEDFQSAVTKGQFLAIYDNSQLIASGVIC